MRNSAEIKKLKILNLLFEELNVCSFDKYISVRNSVNVFI